LSDEFLRDLKKVRDQATRDRIFKQMMKLQDLPESGKPLRYKMKNIRSIRVPPFRILYEIEGEKIIIIAFGHREDVYG